MLSRVRLAVFSALDRPPKGPLEVCLDTFGAETDNRMAIAVRVTAAALVGFGSSEMGTDGVKLYVGHRSPFGVGSPG